VSTNIVIPNLTLPIENSTIDTFYGIWKLTRGLKAAGWTYRASSDGTTKETSGSVDYTYGSKSNLIQDKWGPGTIISGHISSGNSGSIGSLSATTNNSFVLVNSLSGMTANSVGHALTISGATNPTNNGTFTIVAQGSSSSVTIFNPLAVTETASFTITWSERISGSSTITWGAVSNGREQTISGLSGMTSGSYGSASHYIKLEGASNGGNNGIFPILSYVSSTSVVIINSNGISETSAGKWTELDPIGDTYPTNMKSSSTALAWILFQGPSTLKIPINAASTGTFRRGENISQSVTGAQGELITYFWEPSLNTGWLAVMPRVIGSGAGKLGWSTGSTTITGGTSGATVTTSSSIPIEYVRELVIQKAASTDSQYKGNISFQVVDSNLESAHRFSYLATQTGCTNTVAPGGVAPDSSTNNPFPFLGTYVVKGNPVNPTTYSSEWIGNSTNAYTFVGKSHLILVNAEFTTNISADGSFNFLVGLLANFQLYNQCSAGHTGFGFHRLDNTEEGDIDPYVWYVPLTVNQAAGIMSCGEFRYLKTGTNANLGSFGNPPSMIDAFGHHKVMTYNAPWFKGTCRRGMANTLPYVYDHFQTFMVGYLGTAGGDRSFLYYNYNNDSVATSVSNTPPKVLEPIWVISEQYAGGYQAIGTYNTFSYTSWPFSRVRKGTLRWIYVVSGGGANDTYNNKQWIQLSGGPRVNPSLTLNTHNGFFILGPWDGTTVPILG
jgi:hypothetical protein